MMSCGGEVDEANEETGKEANHELHDSDECGRSTNHEDAKLRKQ
jgi:hypothetical protein